MIKRVVDARFYVLLVALSFVFISGCSKLPAKEIASADKAVSEAKQKEADLYAQDVFSKAEEVLKKAQSQVAEKKYKEAKASAEEALKIAEEAISMVEPNKAKMKAEAEQIIIDVQNSLGELKSSVVKAIKKKAQIDREGLQGMIGKWEIDMVTIQELMQTGKIRQAYDQLVSVQEQVKSQKEGVAAMLEAKSETK